MLNSFAILMAIGMIVSSPSSQRSSRVVVRRFLIGLRAAAGVRDTTVAMVADDQIVSTVGRTTMRYVINGDARNGYQLGAVATHPDHRNRGLVRLLMEKVLSELDAPDQPVILFANPACSTFIPGSGSGGLRKLTSSDIAICIRRARLRRAWTSQAQQTARGCPIIAPEPVLSASALPRATTIRPCYLL